MSESPEWFAPKRYGYGAGLPISWQGWLLTIAFAALLICLALLRRQYPIQLFAIGAPLIAVFAVIASKTTRGGWRWRWGEKD
jgi:hypothetical protein